MSKQTPQRTRKGAAGTGKPQKYLPGKIWAEIERKFIDGESAPALAAEYGISSATINRRSAAGNWVFLRKTCKNSPESGVALSQDKETKPCLILEKTDSLFQLLAESATPQDFQSNLSRISKALLSEGLRDLPKPRNWSEAKILFDMIRKADGLESKENSKNSGSLVAPLRTLRRSFSKIIDAQTGEDLAGQVKTPSQDREEVI